MVRGIDRGSQRPLLGALIAVAADGEHNRGRGARMAPVLVQVYLRMSVVVCPVDEWPYLEDDVLRKSRSRKVCMTCHWFRHHAGVGCVPVLTCQLHQGLIAHGEHLTSRCQGWTDDLVRQRGWAPEVA